MVGLDKLLSYRTEIHIQSVSYGPTNSCPTACGLQAATSSTARERLEPKNLTVIGLGLQALNAPELNTCLAKQPARVHPHIVGRVDCHVRSPTREAQGAATKQACHKERQSAAAQVSKKLSNKGIEP